MVQTASAAVMPGKRITITPVGSCKAISKQINEDQMTRRSIFGIFFLVMATAITSLSLGATSASAKPNAHFVDILYLQEGKTPEDAMAYFKNVEPIIKRHGLRRVSPAFVITKKMSGNISPNLVNLWSVSDPQNTFQSIFADQSYLSYIPLRNSIFDMKRSHMFMLKAVE